MTLHNHVAQNELKRRIYYVKNINSILKRMPRSNYIYLLHSSLRILSYKKKKKSNNVKKVYDIIKFLAPCIKYRHD